MRFYKIRALFKLGLLIVIIGVVILITKGSIEILTKLKFSIGDLYMLLAVILFAVYTLTLRVRPKEISQSTFFYLMVVIGIIPLFIAMLLSGEQSSTTISSISRNVCSNNERMQRSTKRSTLYTGIITETFII